MPILTLYDDAIPIWQVTINDVNVLAGMAAAGIGITTELNRLNNKKYYVDTEADISGYNLATSVPEEEIQIVSAGRLNPNEFGFWLKGNERFRYNLYHFKDNAFMQGIISMANTFQVDFRDYIFGVPFDYLGQLYTPSDYIMAPYSYWNDAPDIDDIELEEEDDENIITPLERTDDIIPANNDEHYFNRLE